MKYLTEDDYQEAEKNGIDRMNAYQRFYKYGWSREEVVTKPLKTKVSLKSEWEKVAKEKGISYCTFRNRIQLLGWSIEKASNTMPGSAQRKPTKRSGRLTQSEYEIAMKNGINKSTVHSRVYRNKWPVHLAITLPVGSKLKNVKGKM